jgi:hypothetical protein
MALEPIYRRVIGLDIHQAKIIACVCRRLEKARKLRVTAFSLNPN